MKKIAFLIHMNMYIFIILTIISLINTQEQSKTSEESTNNIDPPKKEVTKENKLENIITFINCDKFCSKFEPTCPEIYNEVIKLSTEYIILNNLISSSPEKNKNIPYEISKAFYYKGIYEYYGITSEKSNPNLEVGLANFIIASYFGSKEANYRLFILYESDLISHIIYTNKFKKILEKDKLLNLIQKTDFWNNFDFFYKYPTTNSTNENIRRNLQNEIGYNFLYLSILKKYDPAMLVGGTKYSVGIGVEKKCDVATEFLKEVSFKNIAGKINDPKMKGNFLFQRFRLETYESIENIYKKKNQISSLEHLLSVLNILKEDQDKELKKKKEVISEIGIRYFYGVDVEQDYRKAKEWFELGINYNIGQCYGFLGEIYLHGFGLKKEEIDYKKAFDYFEKAMTYGESAMGLSGMGYMYYYGLGVKKDKKEAYNCFLKGIRTSKKDSSWEITSLYFNMISLLIEDDSEDEEENFEFRTMFNDMFVDFDINEKDEINNNLNLLTEKKQKQIKEESKDNIKENAKNKNEKSNNVEYPINNKDENIIKDKTKETTAKTEKDKTKDKKNKEIINSKVPKDFNLAYKYANYLTLKNRSYGTYILAMMNFYNINAKLFSCEENLNFFRTTSDTNIDTINRVKLSQKLYESQRYKSAFLIMMELAFEGHEDSLPNIVSVLIKRQIFKEHGFQKYLTHYFIELGLKLEYYDLYFLSLGASFYYKEKKYDRAIELYKLLINHAGGKDKKLYVAEGFFNLGLMENFGYGIPKNLTKSKNFFDQAEKYESNCYYPVWGVNLLNKFLKIFGKGGYNNDDSYIKNDTIIVNKNTTLGKFGMIKTFFEKLNILSVAVFFFLIFYGWFFFDLKFQGSDGGN